MKFNFKVHAALTVSLMPKFQRHWPEQETSAQTANDLSLQRRSSEPLGDVANANEMLRCWVALLVIAALAMPAGASVDLTSWDNLRQLAAGQQIEIARNQAEALKGEFVRVTDEAVTVRTRRGEVTAARSEIIEVRRTSVGRKDTWVGAGVGAGAGALIGLGAGEALANASGGDFANLKPAIIGACAAAGALVGVLIGSVFGNRHSVVYRK